MRAGRAWASLAGHARLGSVRDGNVFDLTQRPGSASYGTDDEIGGAVTAAAISKSLRLRVVDRVCRMLALGSAAAEVRPVVGILT